MAIAIIATLKVAEGKEAEFEEAFLKLVHQTKTTEPGNIAYELVKSRTDGTYKVMELYKDEAALQAHRDAPKDLAKALIPMMAGRADIEILDVVG